jgi:hypothetical protein
MTTTMSKIRNRRPSPTIADLFGVSTRTITNWMLRSARRSLRLRLDEQTCPIKIKTSIR